MKPMTGRQILVLTVFITATTALMVNITTNGDLWTTLLTIPLVASTAFWSMRLSQRLAMRFGPRYAAREAQLQPQTSTEATSERPDHARRRREQRRPRGRRRPE